jgi:dTDP-glucose pyrophosphorylase
MVNFDKYLISSTATVREALVRLNALSSDILVLFVVKNKNQLIGTLTDGDIRRGLIGGKSLDDNVVLFYHENYYYLNKSNQSIELIKKFREEKIKLVPFLDDNGCIIRVYNFTNRKSILPIDAVLMAGGRGERLRPLTDKTPKPLLNVGNKPIIEHNIDNLAQHGVDNFFITVNYLAEQIINYFGDGQKKNINISYIKENKPMGTIGSVSLIKEFKNDSILVMNSDIFTNINYEDFYQDFSNSNADMAVASIPYNVSIPYAILNLEDSIIKSFEEKPSYTFYANAGIYLIKKELLKKIPENCIFHATDLLQTLILEGLKVIKYPIVGYWVDIGRFEDLNKVQEFVKHLKE